MIHINNPAECCGCTACASICAHNAITMKPDALGFLYPEVDFDKCIDCKLCQKVCAFNDNYDTTENMAPLFYGARHRNHEFMRYSRSGAVFIALSDIILQEGGIIYGVGYGDHFKVVHKRAVTKDERDEFKGSKYVQSDLKDTFRQVKKDLVEGKIVLFSGTPCQTAGLHSFIPKRLRERLFLVDIICHATPSPYIWRDYLKYIESKEHKQIKFCYFRDKTHGWNAPHMEKFIFDDGSSKELYTYRYLFYSSLDTRWSCHSCHFTNLTRRPSDITIGDFWGIEKVNPQFNSDNKGVSLVIVNSEKGKHLFAKCQSDLEIIKVEMKDTLQPNLLHPTPANPKRKAFEIDYLKKGFLYVAKKYGNIGWRYPLNQFISRVKNKFIK